MTYHNKTVVLGMDEQSLGDITTGSGIRVDPAWHASLCSG